MKTRYFAFFLITILTVSCKVEFNPNAPWKDVPSVYCVLDPEEDTVWARVQRCYLGEGNQFSYSTIPDSIYYKEEDIEVHLLAWRGVSGPNHSINPTDQLVDRWVMNYTVRNNKPEGVFAGGEHPLYYCIPGRHQMIKDSSCVFEILIIRSSSHDTIARAKTTLVGFLPFVINYNDTSEAVLTAPSRGAGRHYGFIPKSRNDIKWNTLPRGRRYQPAVTFYYKKLQDTLSVTVYGDYLTNEFNNSSLNSSSITQSKFLSTIKRELANNTDTLFNVNHVDISIYVCNEDLNAYINSQSTGTTSGQELQSYSNIVGGVGIFGSRRTHIQVKVPCDSTGKPDYLPAQLRNLGVGFYGNFTPQSKQ